MTALEWTLNDVPLHGMFDGESHLSPLCSEAPASERQELLARLRGDRCDPPTFVKRFERTWLDRLLRRRGIPWAPFGPAFEDGRVVLLRCPCGDLDCGALTTEVVVGDDVVEWREIGWQVTYESFTGSNDAIRSAQFDRAQYTSVMDDLASRDLDQLT